MELLKTVIRIVCYQFGRGLCWWLDIRSFNCQLNQSKVDYCFESNQVTEFLCDVDELLVPKVGMTFNMLEEIKKFYKDYSKFTDFSTKIRNTNKKENEIKNQLITCTKEGK
ncbi:hypothetical protein Ahy_A07g032876 [Arachis hypogaea]|uniref:FAR1 domain-containing protein n=1 Tax=Arachis hypogaea TaxID=3818 RepID=A0A445C7S2_ARAHY|nr:hypothetical protein Ahy_A07g032876 [Arachis hypogaea]